LSYKLKTLIAFDTNSLRSTEEGEVAYSFFAFGKPFQTIEEYIIDKNLADEIHLAIPDWAIQELKDQKQRRYLLDVEEYKKLAKRLSGLPHTGEITFPEVEFDCATYVEQKATEFIGTKKIKLLELKEEIANKVLRSMMARVLKDEGKKAPFANLGKTYKDAGFKDNLVWESLMNFEEVSNYDKVIFLTKDGDFNVHCKTEFKTKWERHIAIEKDENNVIAEINKDYGNYIKERVIHDFAQSEYFIAYLESELKSKVLITISEIDEPIESYQIKDVNGYVNRLVPDEDGVVSFLISSKILITYKSNGDIKKQEIEALTTLYDEETKEIISTEFDFNLQ
jgi:hypothetical protein